MHICNLDTELCVVFSRNQSLSLLDGDNFSKTAFYNKSIIEYVLN